MFMVRGFCSRLLYFKCELKLLRYISCEETKQKLLCKVQEEPENSLNKVSVIGCGAVGMATIIGLLVTATTNNLAMVDMDEKRLIGERMDLEHGSRSLNDAKIEASTNYAVTAGSKVCVVCAGVRQEPGESRLKLVGRNVEVFKKIIPQLVKYSPDTVILVVANPVDILTYCAWKLSGLPKNRVIGSGCALDSARFRFYIAHRLGIPTSAVHGWIIGEHGDSSIACWSGVNVAGVRLMDINPKIGTADDDENWIKCHKDVIESAGEVIRLKGFTNWAIGLNIFPLVSAILKNNGQLHPISCNVCGHYGVEKDIYMSLPCTLGQTGVIQIVKQILTVSEQAKFTASATILSQMVDDIKF